MFFEQRTLNLMLLTFWFFFMHAAANSLAQSYTVSHLSFPASRSRFVLICCLGPIQMYFVLFPCGVQVNVHLASLRLQISMNCLMSETSEGILTDM
jgi:hypothetical protein